MTPSPATSPSAVPTNASTIASSRSVDVVVIGAGSGGLTVAVGLARLGRRAVLIERGLVGGDCTNVGCIPSKSLLHHTSELRGRSASEILQAVRDARDELREHETEEFTAIDGFELIRGAAELAEGGRVLVTSETDGRAVVSELLAANIVIATGSRARSLDIAGLPTDRMLTNEHLFELTDAPEHLAIVGAGPIGAEMALAFRRLGSRVTVLDAAPQVMPNLLPEAASLVYESLSQLDADLRPGFVAMGYDEATHELAIGPLGGEVSAKLAGVDKVLVAIGRVPNVEGLGLEALGVEQDRQGRIEIDDKGRTNVGGLWAVGDVTTEGGTTHDATIWGRRVLKALTASYAPAGPRPVRTGVTFTQPEAATIGEQPTDVRSDVRRLTVQLRAVDRGFTDEADGIIIVDVRKLSGTILGATVVGPRAGELISIFSLAMKNDISLRKWYGVVWPYPTYADALNQIVDEFMVELIDDIPGQTFQWAKGGLSRLLRR